MLVKQRLRQKIEQSTIDPKVVVHTRGKGHGPSCIPVLTQEQPPVTQEDKKSTSLEAILSRANMFTALDRVEKNRGAAGVDGMETQDLRAFLKVEWPQIRTSILTGKFKPTPVRQVDIPKPDGGTRSLGIPTVLDRLVQQAIAQVLTPIFDPIFSESSYGFRQGKRAHQAIIKAKEYVRNGNRYVVDIDLESFFNRVNHDLLMARVSRRVKDKRVLQITRAYLEAGIMSGGLVSASREGTPQGSPLSPLLSNIMLDDLDKELEKRGHEFCRYADDCNIYVKTKRAGQRVFANTRLFIEKRLKLKINDSKSAVALACKRKFLGFQLVGVQQPKISVAKKSIERFKTKVKSITRGHHRRNMEGRLRALSRLTQGWMQYFKIIDTTGPIRDLDSWIRHRLRMCLLKQWWRPRTRVRMFMKQGMYRSQARVYAQAKRYWFLSDTANINAIFNNKYWASKGYVSLMSILELYRQEL